MAHHVTASSCSTPTGSPSASRAAAPWVQASGRAISVRASTRRSRGRGSGGGHGPACLQAWSGVRARHVESVVEHGDDVGVAVVLVEADVAFVIAELEGGAVEETACPIDGRADPAADGLVRAQHMSGEADRARGAEAAAAVEGGERPPVPVEGDGALRPAAGVRDQRAGDREDIDRTECLRPGHGADRLVETGDGHGVGRLAVKKPGRARPAARDAESGIVQLPVRLGDVVPGGLRIGGGAVEGAGGAPADGVVRPPLAAVPVGIQRVGPGAPARGIGHDGARGDQQRRDFDDIGSWVHCNSSLLSDRDRRPPHRWSRGGPERRVPAARRDVSAMGEGTRSDRLSPWPPPGAPGVLAPPLSPTRDGTVRPVARVRGSVGDLQAGRVLRVCAQGHRSQSLRRVRGIPPHSPSLWL